MKARALPFMNRERRLASVRIRVRQRLLGVTRPSLFFVSERLGTPCPLRSKLSDADAIAASLPA